MVTLLRFSQVKAGSANSHIRIEQWGEGKLSLSSANLINTSSSLLVLVSNPVPPRHHCPIAAFTSSLPAPFPLAISLTQQSPSFLPPFSALVDLYTLNPPSLEVEACACKCQLAKGFPAKALWFPAGPLGPPWAQLEQHQTMSPALIPPPHSSHTLTATSWHLYLNFPWCISGH